MKNCTHTEKVPGRWVPNPFHDPEEWACGGYDTGPLEWERGHDRATVVDVDLHRYKCTQCGEVMYYSARARQHFEEGVNFPGVKGLE